VPNHASPQPHVTVVGGGLAGTEAAWQLAQRGICTRLVEMRPATMTPAHHTGGLAELVCSNSLKSDDPNTAVPHHNGRFDVDEDAVLTGSLLFVKYVMSRHL